MNDILSAADINEGREKRYTELAGSERPGRAYVPFQKPGKLFCPAAALRNGTAFPDLHHPYEHDRHTGR